MNTRTALIAVDVQGTFADDFPDAGLPVPGAGERIEPIRDFTLRAARLPGVVAVVTSQDWHPEQLPEHMVERDGDEPDFARKLFTRHGIAGTAEAELHPRFAGDDVLEVITDMVRKGQDRAAFSAFEGRDAEGRSLEEILAARGASRVVVYGFELANCVSATALDAARIGYETYVLPELCSVLEPVRTEETLEMLGAAGVRVVSAQQVLSLLGPEAGDERSEEEYLADYARTERRRYPRSEHTVDIALFTIREGQLSLLLVRRAGHPERGRWALPGGFVDLGKHGGFGEGEGLDEAARRELLEETGLEVFTGYLEQLRTYGDPWRDRRGRVFSTAYVGMMPHLALPRAGSDAAAAHFFAVDDLAVPDGPQLAFDHERIVAEALERVRGKIEYEGRLAASFLPEPFTVPELRRVYEAVWGGSVHRADFRRKVLSARGFLEPTGGTSQDTGGPPAQLFRLGAATHLHPPMPRSGVLLRPPNGANHGPDAGG